MRQTAVGAPIHGRACTRLVVIGASAGGLEVLCEIARGLPSDFPAAVGVVVHVSPTGPALLPAILRRAGPLPAAYATDGEPLQCGRIYIAPANRHFLVENGRVVLGAGPRENGFRPAIDPLFRSAANAFGSGAIGVILSGAMDDGTAGLAAIKERGGLAVVQNPDTALVPSMPQSAIRDIRVDCIADPSELARALLRLAPPPVPAAMPPDADRTDEADMVSAESGRIERPAVEPTGVPSLRCPDCGGPMHDTGDPHILRYRCHEGHVYTAGSLLGKQIEQNGATLRQATSALREQAALGRQVADRAEARGDRQFADFIRRTVVRVEERATRLGDLLRESEADPDIET